MTTRRRVLRSDWPTCLDFYDPVRYARAGELPPVVWLSLLSERARAAQAPEDEARALVQKFQANPLAVSTARIPLERPVADVGFDDHVFMLSILAHPAVAAELDAWAEAPPVGARMLNAIFCGGRSPASDPTLHDLMLDEYAKRPDIDPTELGLHRVMVRVDLRLPDTVLEAQFERWLKERRKRLKSVGVTFGSAPRRSQHAAGHIGPEQIRRWTELRVLDYLDIQLTCRLAGVKMPNAATLGQKLFATVRKIKGDGDADTTDRVRAHTCPEAKRVVQRAFLDSFDAHVAAAALNQESSES